MRAMTLGVAKSWRREWRTARSAQRSTTCPARTRCPRGTRRMPPAPAADRLHGDSAVRAVSLSQQRSEPKPQPTAGCLSHGRRRVALESSTVWAQCSATLSVQHSTMQLATVGSVVRRLGAARRGTVQGCLAWLGSAWLGLAWRISDSAQRRAVPLCNTSCRSACTSASILCSALPRVKNESFGSVRLRSIAICALACAATGALTALTD